MSMEKIISKPKKYKKKWQRKSKIPSIAKFLKHHSPVTIFYFEIGISSVMEKHCPTYMVT